MADCNQVVLTLPNNFCPCQQNAVKAVRHVYFTPVEVCTIVPAKIISYHSSLQSLWQPGRQELLSKGAGSTGSSTQITWSFQKDLQHGLVDLHLRSKKLVWKFAQKAAKHCKSLMFKVPWAWGNTHEWLPQEIDYAGQ